MAWLGFLIGMWVGAGVMAVMIAIFRSAAEYDEAVERSYEEKRSFRPAGHGM